MTKYFEEKERVQLLIKVEGEYIALLEKALNEVFGLAFVHGYVPNKKDVELGHLLREKIRLLTRDKYGQPI